MNNDIAKDAAELLPCPFCGSAGKHFPMMGGVMCSNKECNGMAAAFSAGEWNTRATAADMDRIAELGRRLAIEEECSGALKDAADDRDGYYQQLLEARAQLAAKTQECEGLREAIKPFASCAENLTTFRSVSTEDTWLWKPSQTSRELPGISAAMILRAAAALSDSARKEVE